jgi:hypothetical protein
VPKVAGKLESESTSRFRGCERECRGPMWQGKVRLGGRRQLVDPPPSIPPRHSTSFPLPYHLLITSLPPAFRLLTTSFPPPHHLLTTFLPPPHHLFTTSLRPPSNGREGRLIMKMLMLSHTTGRQNIFDLEDPTLTPSPRSPFHLSTLGTTAAT